MDKVKQIKQDSINEFGSEVTQDEYRKNVEKGLWGSEKVLVKKYFKAGFKVLDIGCGTGRTTIPLSKMGYDIIGVDITPEMIKTAKEVAKEKNLSIDYRLGDATRLKFKDNSFDSAIFSNNGWTQIPGKENRVQALKEIFRVLKPKGIFILTAHIRYYTFYYLFFWLVRWIKHFIIKPLGIKIKEIDFGDTFFQRDYLGKKLNQIQFIHIASRREMEKSIKEAGFKLKLSKSMAELASKDAEIRRATISKRSNPFKSPVFFVCEK